ncbi:MAG: alpha/beta hydrolase family protein [Stenotrophobium sp.]
MQSQPKRWESLSGVPVIAGLYWLLAESGGHWLIWALIPGALLLSTGVTLLLMPGDERATGYMSLGGIIGVLLSLGAMISGHFGAALLCAFGSAASYLVAGRAGLTMAVRDADAPTLELSLAIDAKAALDEALLAYFVTSIKFPVGDEGERLCADALKLDAALKERGWDRDPALFHRAPSAPGEAVSSKQRIYGFDYELLRWDSGFAPEDALPGAALWKSYAENNRCAVRVLRHAGQKRPWLLCIHGYRMGAPWMDFGLFAPRWLHERLGVNMVQPVLPLHGPRRIGLRSGDYFLDGDVLDLVYAEAQALWDLRRTLAWIRTQEESPRIGVYGVSLGGYNASLLAAYEASLDFVVAGIPVIDFASALWRFIPSAHQNYFARQGLNEERYREILHVISPLARPPQLDKSRLLIFAGAADRVVPPRHPLELSRHWDVPVKWYNGSHLSISREPEVAETVREAMLRAGWPSLV